MVVHPHAAGRGDARAKEEHAGQGAPLAARQVQLRDLERRQAQDRDVDQDVGDDHAEAVADLGDAVTLREGDVKGLADRRALEDVDQHAGNTPHDCQRGEDETTALHGGGREQSPVQREDAEFGCHNRACVDDLTGVEELCA